MSNRERDAICAWLDFIEETDPLTIAEILAKCENVLDARAVKFVYCVPPSL